MPQFFIAPDQIRGNQASLPSNEAKHLIKVLRYKKGDVVWLTDGQFRYRGLIETITPKEAFLKLLEKHRPILKAPAPALGLPPLKHDHLEWVLQKGVELGVHDFFLFVSERTIPHYTAATTPKKLARFEKIALEATKQSGLATMPKILPPIPFVKFVSQFKNFTAVLLAWEHEKENSLHSVFQTIDSSKLLVLIGPEGGFSAHEVALAEQAEAKKIGLGGQILRSETAALTLLALCQYELGNI